MSDLLFIVIGLLIVSAFCSGAEAAIFSVNIGQVHAAKKRKDARAKILENIKNNPSRPIAAIVILNNIANIVGSMMAGIVATNIFDSTWLGIFSAVLTFAVIIFAEIIPKAIGVSNAEYIALRAARPIMILAKIFTPMIWITEIFSLPFQQKGDTQMTSEEEIAALAHLGGREWSIEHGERKMIEKVFKLNDVTAGDIMTPRTETVFVQAGDTLDDILKLIEKKKYTRLPVIDENFDDVVGIIFSRKVLLSLTKTAKNKKLKSSKIMKPVFFVPEDMPGDTLLRKFQKTRQHLFVVQDDHGGTAGIVTLEDVLEELVGEIEDERDAEKRKKK